MPELQLCGPSPACDDAVVPPQHAVLLSEAVYGGQALGPKLLFTESLLASVTEVPLTAVW